MNVDGYCVHEICLCNKVRIFYVSPLRNGPSNKVNNSMIIRDSRILGDDGVSIISAKW